MHRSQYCRYQPNDMAFTFNNIQGHIDGLVQEGRKSSA